MNPDIMTQAKPNSFVQPINPHKAALTPTNRLKLNSEDLLLFLNSLNDNESKRNK